ncbi:MAG: response regulator [Hansschlegelia sp.]
MTHPATVAIVDDDTRLLESLRELLESVGFNVVTYPSGRQLVRSDAFALMDCLITDIGMPGLDGFELERLVRERRPEVPVFLITGRHELAERRAAQDDESRPIFRKPFDGKALLAAIGEALAKSDGNLP